MGEETFDNSRAAELARQVGTDFGAALTVALAFIGDRLGLFRLLADGEQRTSAQIAEKAGLNERYVREWAATMAAAGYLTYRPDDSSFHMTTEQAMVLGRENNTFFSAGTFQYAVACYRQIAKLTDAFRDGGGVPFTDYGSDIIEAIERMFHCGYEEWVADQWIPALPDLKAKLEQGAEVAEVGCGAGQCTVPVAMAFPNSRFTGFDVDAASLARAQNKATKAGVIDRLSFKQVAAERIPEADRFDLVMAFNCIHDMANPRGALAGIRRALKPKGILLWSEANAADRLEENLTTNGRAMYGASTMHCMTVSLAQGGEGLGVVIGESLARELATEAGYAGFERLPIKNPFHQIFVLRK
ncbi:MAG TPA: methyltransferase domain-containing protein [Candidatus Binataceae bacterium]|nr:methyltransferase domain-containing protein [Candidatus Binataceae bacterium]